jgi:hypothetical protein
MNINAPVAVRDLKFNRKCQIRPFKPAINYPVLAAKPNPSQKSSQLPPSCSRDRDGMSPTTRTNSKSRGVNQRTKGNQLTPARLNPKPTARPVRPALRVDPAQHHQHPHPRHLRQDLRDRERLQDRGPLPVQVFPPDQDLPLRLTVIPNTSRRCTGRGICATFLTTTEILHYHNPANILHY